MLARRLRRVQALKRGLGFESKLPRSLAASPWMEMGLMRSLAWLNLSARVDLLNSHWMIELVTRWMEIEMPR